MQPFTHIGRTSLVVASLMATMGAAAEVLPYLGGGPLSGGHTSRTPKRKSRIRRAAARVGGNWQGKQYLTYAEHDQCTRAKIAAGGDRTAYDAERDRIVEARRT